MLLYVLSLTVWYVTHHPQEKEEVSFDIEKRFPNLVPLEMLHMNVLARRLAQRLVSFTLFSTPV